MDLAPIVMFTFNRLEHTKKTIEALKKITLLKNQKYLFLVMDQEMSKKN
ncbi:hypothetical protein [Clostridium beijerinckii]|nr:hypothetical protein [Clostridium beijerinckii]NRU31780.1 GT2 family glycosyltransferase [Clostridium beijerinckii]NRW81942.1 GT2 family glycosyltransferase [Clostridium beijerinckii]